MKTVLATLMLLVTAAALHAQTKPAYENNFEKAAVDSVPEGFLVLDGGFAVKEEGGNKFLELPGAPLDTFGALFGPTEAANISVTARIYGTGKGRRFPTMAVGLNGGGGYKLQVSPGKKLIELYKGEEVKATAPIEWASGTWTMFRLQVRKVKDGEWKVEGKAWAQTGKEPVEWAINFTDAQEPPPGRPSIWGNPFSTTPIYFDDLVVTPVK